MNDAPKTPQVNGKTLRMSTMRVADLGINLVVFVLVVGGLGYWLDGVLDWTPWGMLLGGFLGFAAWLRTVFKQLTKGEALKHERDA